MDYCVHGVTPMSAKRNNLNSHLLQKGGLLDKYFPIMSANCKDYVIGSKKVGCRMKREEQGVNIFFIHQNCHDF